jgi:hypothetical protein
VCCRLILVSLRAVLFYFFVPNLPITKVAFHCLTSPRGSSLSSALRIVLQRRTSPRPRPSTPIPRPSMLHTGRIVSRDHAPNDRASPSRSPRSPRSRRFAPTSVEEHRERAAGADRETRTATRRRPGDRSHENEVHADKERKRTERETRRTAGDDSIKRFKREWSDKSARIETRIGRR